MKTWEMIKMLGENPKLKFVTKRNGVATEPLTISDFGYISWEKQSYGVPSLKANEEWELIREPVPVWEAIKALIEGKKVICIGASFCSAICYFQKGNKQIHSLSETCLISGTWHIEQEVN
jgi:hypothetical protein